MGTIRANRISQAAIGWRIYSRLLITRANFGDLANRSLDTLFIWQDRARQRRLLLRLEDHVLKDMGMSRADAYKEAYKPFWRK